MNLHLQLVEKSHLQDSERFHLQDPCVIAFAGSCAIAFVTRSLKLAFICVTVNSHERVCHQGRLMTQARPRNLDSLWEVLNVFLFGPSSDNLDHPRSVSRAVPSGADEPAIQGPGRNMLFFNGIGPVSSFFAGSVIR